MKKRIFWIDVVKVIAICMVIYAHVFWIIRDAKIDGTFAMEFFLKNSIVVSLGVPLFMMVSGTLLFDKSFTSKLDILAFYKRSLLPLVITAEIWIIAYSLVVQESFSLKELLLCMIFIHKPEVHLWYVRMIVMYYLAVPFLNILRQRYKYVFISLLLAVLAFTFVYNGWLIWKGDLCPTTPSRSYLCYLVYMAIGYWISKMDISMSRCFIAVCGMLFGSYILFSSLRATEYFLWYDNPLLACIAISLFYIIRAGFDSYTMSGKLQSWISEISKMSYGIYLSHFILIYAVGMYFHLYGCSEMMLLYR